MSWFDVKPTDFQSFLSGWLSVHERQGGFKSGWSDVQGGRGIGFPWAVQSSTPGSFFSNEWSKSVGNSNGLSSGWNQVRAGIGLGNAWSEVKGGGGFSSPWLQARGGNGLDNGWSNVTKSALSRGGWLSVKQPRKDEVELLGEMVWSGSKKIASYSKKGYQIAKEKLGGLMKKVTSFKKKETLSSLEDKFKELGEKREKLQSLQSKQEPQPKKPHLTLVKSDRKPDQKKEPHQKKEVEKAVNTKENSLSIDLSKIDFSRDLAEQFPAEMVPQVKETLWAVDQAYRKREGEKYVPRFPASAMEKPKDEPGVIRKYDVNFIPGPAPEPEKDDFFIPEPPPENIERTFALSDERPVKKNLENDRELER